MAKIPKYLQRFRKEEETERQKTLQEIEINKLPIGTRLVAADEKSKTLNELYGKKASLVEGIEKMSVTLYTKRAQN